MMKVTLRISSLLFGLVLWCTAAWAQPANDNCTSATEVNIAANEASVVMINGDTRGATQSLAPAQSCGGTWTNDDVWFKITTPADFAASALVFRAYFNQGVNITDVATLGMGLYDGCAALDTALQCYASNRGTDDRMMVPTDCLEPNTTYYLRTWTAGNNALQNGTFRFGVYYEGYKVENVLWHEKFDTNPFERGWDTYGVSAIIPDSSVNAVWIWEPDASIDESAFTDYTTVQSPTFCDGAMAVNSDFNDNGGTGVAATGPVPTSLNATGSQSNPATYELESPAIFIGDWDVEGISVEFWQSLRTLNSDFSISFRNKNAGDPNWTSWVSFPLNEDVIVNASPTDNKIRQYLPGAHDADSLQLKVTYLAHYYYWIIDDLRIIETECTNTRVQENFFAVAPWASVPANQVYDYPVLADIYNAGACTQTNVTLNHTVTDQEGTVVSNMDLTYGSIEPDSLAENKAFPNLVEIPFDVTANYTGTYTIRQDLPDFDSSDNVITYEFSVGGDEFRLEDGATTSITAAASNYNVGAPRSFTYGNFFFPQEDVRVDSIAWAVGNPEDLAGRFVNINLFQWTDTNNDEVVQADERRFIGSREYEFTGAEGSNTLVYTELENLEGDPDDPIVMLAGFGYIAMVEYPAFSPDDPDMFMSVSQARDYSALNLAFDQAFTAGQVNHRFYSSILGLSPDGSLSDIDYGTVGFGFDYAPVVRILVDLIVNTNEDLPLANQITAFPNPATDNVAVKLQFEKPYDNVKVRLINHIGQTVYTKSLTATITTHTENIRVSDLSAGNYMLQVETPDGQRSIPVIVVK